MKNNYKNIILENLRTHSSTKTSRLNCVFYINEALKPFNLLKEDSNFTGNVNPDNPNQISWDNLETNIEKSTRGVRTLDQMKSYFNLLNSKVKALPRNVKKKAFNAAIIGLGTIMLANIGNTKTVVDELPQDVKANVLSIDNPVMKTLKDVDVKPEPLAKVRTVSDTLVNFLKNEEGSPKHKGQPVLTAYNLGDGAITIGWGHAEPRANTKMVAGKTKITKEKAEQLLQKDVKWASDRLNVILNDWESDGIEVNVTQGMYDSMTSMIFNMGIGNFRKSKFIQLVKQNKLQAAKAFIKNTHITYPGHKPRREQESDMFVLP